LRPEVKSSLKDLIKKTMTKEPVLRITLPEIKVHINSFTYLHAIAYLGFCEGGGGRAKDARFEAPEAPMGWSVGRGCPLPTEEGVLGGGCAPSPEIFKNFFGSMCSKNFCV